MANNSYTKTYSDGQALTETKLDTAYQSLKLDITNTDLMTTGATAGHFLKVVSPGAAASFAAIPDPKSANTIRNYGLKATVASGAIVFSLTSGSGTTPTGSDSVDVSFSANSTTSATQSDLSVTSARNITLNASASLGISGTSTQRIYVYAINNTGTVRLALSNRGDYDVGFPITTTAISSAADSNNVLYATVSISTAARLLGWVNAAKNSTGSWQTPTAVGLSDSPSSGVVLSNAAIFSSTSSSFVDVTNLSQSFTTNGRPVEISIVCGDSTSPNAFVVDRSSGTGDMEAQFQYLRGTVAIGLTRLLTKNPASGAANLAIPTIHTVIDNPAAGTYTYKMQGKVVSGTSFSVNYAKLAIRQL